ncbi:hypothetical protein F7018_15935 [Tenacibaculum aiptasiae]|uniref:Uncharacterized protein n=1 Tax=Tenacibaculum aiptasiae TaxID=426481 RepID=A0A7J5A937_9FLAO|nr:hypothetical protein [Tenacibaculum aiptasiae]KAB1153973.1 hypothetical protein F7018_15935 [Tenacibaculum aiptasiae]
MSRVNLLVVIISLLLVSSFSYGQDTIRLNKKPKVILKSWYPDFKELPHLKVDESKVLYISIPDVENTSISDNNIHLISLNNSVQIKETEKLNQYLVSVTSTSKSHVGFELWLELNDKTILIKENSKWLDIRKLYRVKGNKVLIAIVKLKIEKE